MTQFAYKAIDGSGRRSSGELDARTRVEALAALQRQQLQPISLEEKSAPSPAEPQTFSTPATQKKPQSAPGKVALKSAEVIHFTEELGDLLEAGLQLESALKSMEQRSGRGALSQAIVKIREQIREGVRFSNALKSVSDSFGELYCSMVTAGEVSGSLAEILRRQVGYLTTLGDLRAKVIQALIYPSFIFGAGIVLLFIFMSVLVPQLSVLFVKTGKQLPLPTRILLGLSTVFFHYWWLILLCIAGLSLAAWRFTSMPAGKFWWHRIQLRIPLVGEILVSRFYAQFGHTMANLTANGLPLLGSLELLGRSLPNLYLRERMDRIIERVGEGGSLARAMAKIGPFPDLMCDMVSIGEQTGEIPATFRKIGERYDKVLNVRIQRLTALIQPVIIIIMALVVGVVAYSILVGIFQAVAGLKAR